jgi:ubiquinone/menaquinone biosynthesis C-methylase UbiE
MNKHFDYETVFMGVRNIKRNYKVSFFEDYRLKRLTELLILKKRSKLLDIGCGGGIITESLQSYFPEVKVYGCDISKKALDYAKKFGKGDIKYKKIINNKLPFENNFFDACIALDVIEHVEDIDFLLKEINRVLKKGGLFLSHTPTEGEKFTHTWLWSKIGIGKEMTYRRYGHIHPELTHRSLLRSIDKSGLKVIKINYSEHFLYQLISLIAYFVPLEILDKLFKKNADLYKDKYINLGKKNENQKNVIMLIRNIMIMFTKFLRLISYWEIDLLKNLSFNALKINVLAQKK